MSRPRLTKLSLFSGIGGDDLASDWTGQIETVCFVEKDKYCQQILKKHWPGIPIIGDVKDVTKDAVNQWVDIVAGGDPCQARSIAGKRRGKADDRDLWPDMFRIIREFKPTWVVNENPTGRLTMDFHPVLSDLASIGYEARAFVIPACAVNALHRRNRLFIVAHTHSNGCKGWGHNEEKGELAIRKIEVPPTWNISGDTFREWEKLNHQSGSVGRYDGLPARLAKIAIRMFGNAVVPQQIYPIYKAIVEVENLLQAVVSEKE